MSGPDEVVRLLGLQPHPEGGWYRETWRDAGGDGSRSAGSAIFYLLRAGEESRWHRIDAAEVWHLYAGGPLELDLSVDGTTVDRLVLGVDLVAGQRPQHVVPAGVWQAARPLAEWSLVGCTVSPAFEFAGCELAPEAWGLRP